MTTRPAKLVWPACLSALHLDRFLMGELDGAAAEQVRVHLAECARCSEAVDGMRIPRAERLPPLRLVKRDPRARRWQRAAVAGLGIAAAASVVLLLRPATERVKGPGFALSMYVEHAGEVRRAGPNEAVAAGDAVRFLVTAPVNGYVAVLSLDPEGHGSVYYPVGARAEPVQAGTEMPCRSERGWTTPWAKNASWECSALPPSSWSRCASSWSEAAIPCPKAAR